MNIEPEMQYLNKLIEDGMYKHLAFSVLNGEMTEEEAWHENAVKVRQMELCRAAPDQWPACDVIWDTRPENFYRALDVMEPTDFSSSFPDVEVLSVDLKELDSKLEKYSGCDDGPFGDDYIGKTAGVVAHLENGGSVTPPFIRIYNDQLSLLGGNHRFRWARHRLQATIPILILSCDKNGIIRLLPSLGKWH